MRYQVGSSPRSPPRQDSSSRPPECSEEARLRPGLVSYTHFLLDEVHEEDRDTEFLLVALRELVAREERPRCVAGDGAAPLEARAHDDLGLQKLGDYFGGCPSCSMGGTTPVTTFF